MRAIRFHEHGEEDVLTVDDVERPDPGAQEIQVETRAIGINHVDTIYREGIFTPPEMPATPGSDFAGIVSAVGEQVEDYAVGDRVHGAGLGGDRTGSYAEYVTAPLSRVSHLPEAVSFEEGAAMGHVGVAAWQAVIHHGDPEPADIVLIHGGGGGVGHIAIQLAANAGATVITTEAEASTRQRLEELGAHHTFDFRRDDLADAILAVGTPSVIVDYFFDHYLEFDIENIAHEGHISVLEFSTEEEGSATIDQSTLRSGLLKDLTIQLVNIYNGDISKILGRLTDLYVRGDFEVEIDDTFDLEEAAAAQHEIVEEIQFGKLVLTV